MNRSEQRIPKLRTRGRANRDKLLRRAEEMLAGNNGQALRFSEIFQSADVSRGSAYRIYNGIEDLMQDLAAEWVQNFEKHLAKINPEPRPETWMQLSDFIIESGREYWAATSNTLKVMPRIRSNAPASYKTAVHELGDCLKNLYARYFDIPDLPDWHHKLMFYTQLCDITFSDAARAEGSISDERLALAQMLCKTYLGEFLPESVPPRDPPRVIPIR